MTKVFLNSAEVEINKGYLSAVNKEGKVSPISNKEFVTAQKLAEYVTTFAEKAKGKNFKVNKIDSLEDLKTEVYTSLATKDTKYLKSPKKVEKKLTEQLANEALSFINYTEESSKVDKINTYLQRFNVINEFEDIGLFFEPEIIKINKIYTIKEITKAVTSIIELVD